MNKLTNFNNINGNSVIAVEISSATEFIIFRKDFPFRVLMVINQFYLFFWVTCLMEYEHYLQFIKISNNILVLMK